MSSTSKEREKKAEILSYFHLQILDPILISLTASQSLKRQICQAMRKMGRYDSCTVLKCYWTEIQGEDRRTKLADQMRDEGFPRFEQMAEEVKMKFNTTWLRS